MEKSGNFVKDLEFLNKNNAEKEKAVSQKDMAVLDERVIVEIST